MKKYISLLLLLTAMFSLVFAGKNDDLAERTAEWFKNNPNSMPHWMTPDELERVGSIGKDFLATPPPTGDVRQTAEFERMQGVFIRYEFGIPMDLVQEMATHTDVYTIVGSSFDKDTVIDQYVSAGVDTSNCEFMIEPTDSYWTRDYGPWYVVNGDNEVGICDFMYNRPRPNDDAIPSKAAPYLDEPYYGMSVVHTGGNYMTDGMGIAASTPIVYTESLDQQGITESEVDQRMLDYLGIHTYHVVDDPNNTYIDHIDCWSKFLDVDKILIREVPTDHPQYTEIEQVADYFANQVTSYGNNYQVYRVNTPNDEPYGNSLILNDHVYVPIMNSSNDAAALAVYEAAMPGYTIVPIPGGLQPWESTDALHCRTRGVVDKEMLHIYHVAKVFDQSPSQNYEISAKIVSYGGHTITSADIYYKVDNGSWNSLAMTLSKGEYTAAIPSQPTGSVVSYYINSEDNSGRVENHPFIGQADPHQFNISLVPDINLSQTDTLRASATSLSTTNTSFAINNEGDVNLNYNLSASYQGSGTLTVESNDFESGLIYSNSGILPWGTTTGGTWNSNTICSEVSAASSGASDETGILTSLTFDGTGCTGLYLDFDQDAYLSSSSISVEYYNGTGWEEIYSSSSSVSDHQTLGLPVLYSDMQIRFTATMRRRSNSFWSIDNIVVSGSEDLAWLVFDSSLSGIVTASTGNNIDLTCDATSLSIGNYFAEIRIESNDLDENPLILPVKFTVTDALSAPANLSIVAVSSSAELDWDDVSGASNYVIYRSTDPYSGFAQIDTSFTSDYTDNDVLTGNKYFYRITADNVK